MSWRSCCSLTLCLDSAQCLSIPLAAFDFKVRWSLSAGAEVQQQDEALGRGEETVGGHLSRGKHILWEKPCLHQRGKARRRERLLERFQAQFVTVKGNCIQGLREKTCLTKDSPEVPTDLSISSSHSLSLPIALKNEGKFRDGRMDQPKEGVVRINDDELSARFEQTPDGLCCLHRGGEVLKEKARNGKIERQLWQAGRQNRCLHQTDPVVDLCRKQLFGMG